MLVPINATYAAVIKQSDDPECRVEIVGEISKGDAIAFKRLADYLIEDDGESTSASVVCLDSPGGSVIEGMAMAKFILEKGISTRIREDKQCASICAIMFMMGNYRGGEVAGLSRSMHFTSLLGFHRPYLRSDEASLYTSSDLENTYDLGMETIFEILAVANQREPWGTAQMIEPELMQIMIGTPGSKIFYVSTIEQATRWRIDVDGSPSSIRSGPNQIHYACENALAYSVALTSELNGNEGILGDAIFRFEALNAYSVEQIATKANASFQQRMEVTSIRAGYSGVGCQVQARDQSVAVCGYDESTDVRVGNCDDEAGMRYFPTTSMLHPKTQLITFGFPDDFGSDARRIARCTTYDASLLQTDNQPCLHSVVLTVDETLPLARHYMTWPSGSRTVIEIGAAPYAKTSNYVRINGASGARTPFKGDASCITNQSTGNMICISR